MAHIYGIYYYASNPHYISLYTIYQIYIYIVDEFLDADMEEYWKDAKPKEEIEESKEDSKDPAE